MKKYFAIFAAVALLGMLAIYFAPTTKKQTASTALSTTTTPTITQATTSAATTPTATTPVTTTTPATTGTYKDGSYTGTTASTPYGDVQIAITVSGGKITNVKFLSYPDQDRHSQMISNQATPMLKSQTLNAQSANISGVSGATYTSEGYVQSLQAAIDAAHV